MTFQLEKDWTTKAELRAKAGLVHNSHNCGYVAVGRDHPLFGVNYNQESDVLKRPLSETELGKRGILTLFSAALSEDNSLPKTPELVFNVHGSITFSEPDLEDPGLWWFGFDCAHLGDFLLLPNNGLSPAYRFITTAVWRTIDYVVNECEFLAQQLMDSALYKEKSATTYPGNLSWTNE